MPVWESPSRPAPETGRSDHELASPTRASARLAASEPYVIIMAYLRWLMRGTAKIVTNRRKLGRDA